MDQASVSTEPGLEIGPVNCGKLLNCNEFMKYVVQIVNKERKSLKKKLLLLLLLLLSKMTPIGVRLNLKKIYCNILLCYGVILKDHHNLFDILHAITINQF